MTKNEFTVWQTFHGARFPFWFSWLRKLPQETTGVDVAQRDVAAAMFELLGDVGLDDAKRATTDFSRSDTFDAPLDQHVREVRRLAKRYAAERLDAQGRSIAAKSAGREPTYRCRICWDDGRVSVFHPATMRAARETPELLTTKAKSAYTCAVACCCEAGNAFAEYQKYPRLRPSMFVCESGLVKSQRISELIERQKSRGTEWTGDDFN